MSKPFDDQCNGDLMLCGRGSHAPHCATTVMRQMLDDITFLAAQLDVIEHKQDTDGINAVRKRNSLKRGWQ